MQRTWDFRLWLPTIRPDRLSYHEWKAPTPETINSLAQRLSQVTLDLVALPYDPSLWIQRASVLYTLGYPELSIGDAYKAHLLVEAEQSKEVTVLQDEVRLVVGMRIWLERGSLGKGGTSWEHHEQEVSDELESLAITIWTQMIRGLAAANAFADQVTVCKEAAKRFGNRATSSMLDTTAAEERVSLKTVGARSGELTPQGRRAAVRNGSILGRPYPWMTTDLLQRSNDLLKAMTNQMETLSEGRCTLQRSNIQRNQPDPALGDDVLGIYALRNITKGEELFSDKTIMGVTHRDKGRCALCCRNLSNDDARKCPGCDTTFCSINCLTAATLSGHLSMCGKSISFHGLGDEKPTKYSRLARSKLLMRHLQFIVQHMALVKDDRLHPLQVLPMMRLTPKYTGTEIVPFTLLDDIIHPISMLRTLSIDIFADHRFDTWVLLTMRLRLNNNVVGISNTSTNDFIYGAYPLMTMLNHSCEPAVLYNKTGVDATITLTAARDVAKGEEIFTSYLGEQIRGMALAERRGALMAWLGTPCKCTRCLREERWMRFRSPDATMALPKQTLPTVGE